MNAVSLRWRFCLFDELSVTELDAIFQVRQQVFVIEQACAFADADGRDASSMHLAAWGTAPLPLAYARIVAPGSKYAEPSIGRVLTAASVRGSGLGRELTRRAIACCASAYPGQAIRISAQSRLEAFYADHGFVAVGTTYLEDGIDHTEMLRPA